MRFLRSSATAKAVLSLALLTFTACTSSPDTKSARYIETGKKLLEKKEVSRAILQFQNAVRETPKNPEAHYQLGMAFLAAGDIEHGIAFLQKAVDIDPKHKN